MEKDDDIPEYEPDHNYDPEQEDFACDNCFCTFDVGDTRLHSSIDPEYDCCPNCRTDELDAVHKFEPIVVKVVHNLVTWDPDKD